MGLDMYLDARVSSYKRWDGGPEDPTRIALKAAAEQAGLPANDNLDYIYIRRQVAYWRKANQIHAWFVANVQNGRDECQHSYVSREQLVELRDLCARLLKSRSEVQAREELPPQAGFFFGDTQIDDWYWRGLESTVDQLNKALTLPDHVDFFYNSSW